MTRRVLQKLCAKNVCVDFLLPKPKGGPALGPPIIQSPSAVIFCDAAQASTIDCGPGRGALALGSGMPGMVALQVLDTVRSLTYR